MSYIASQHLSLSSNNATRITDEGSQATFLLRNNIPIPSNVDCYIQLKSFKYSNTFYNITDSNKNVYTSLGDMSVPPGVYSATSLLTALNNLNIVVFEYNPASLRVTVSHAITAFSINSGLHSMNINLGFLEEGDAAVLLAHVAPKCIRLTGIQQIKVRLENLSIATNGVVSDLENVLAAVTNDVLIGRTYVFAPASGYQYKISTTNISLVQIGLYSDKNELLNFLGSDWFLNCFISFQYKGKIEIPEALLRDETQPPPPQTNAPTDNLA